MENKQWKLKLALLLVSSLTIMSVITISPALPEMAIEFADVPNAKLLVQLTVTIPALMIALVSPLTGNMIDRYGRLKILWLSLVLYAISGVSGYILDNLYQIFISRAVLGISVGMSMPIVVTLIADYFQGTERQKFVGLQVAFMSLGGMLFIVLGGILADIGWRYPFLIYFFSLAVLPIGLLFLYEPVVVGQRREDRRQIHAPAFVWLLFTNTMVMWILFFLIPLQVPFHLKAIQIESNSLAGAAIAISTASSAAAAFSYHRIKERLHFVSIFSLGYLLMAAGFFCVAISETYILVVFAMMLAGCGMGIMIPNTNMWVMKIAPPEIRGKEIGKLTTFWFFGQFISPVVILPVLTFLTLRQAFTLAAIFVLILAASLIGFQYFRSEKAATL